MLAGVVGFGAANQVLRHICHIDACAIHLVYFDLRLGTSSTTLHFVQVVRNALLRRSKRQFIARKVHVSALRLVRRALPNRHVHLHGTRPLTSQVHRVCHGLVLGLNVSYTGEIRRQLLLGLLQVPLQSGSLGCDLLLERRHGSRVADFRGTLRYHLLASGTWLVNVLERFSYDVCFGAHSAHFGHLELGRSSSFVAAVELLEFFFLSEHYALLLHVLQLLADVCVDLRCRRLGHIKVDGALR